MRLKPGTPDRPTSDHAAGRTEAEDGLDDDGEDEGEARGTRRHISREKAKQSKAMEKLRAARSRGAGTGRTPPLPHSALATSGPGSFPPPHPWFTQQLLLLALALMVGVLLGRTSVRDEAPFSEEESDNGEEEYQVRRGCRAAPHLIALVLQPVIGIGAGRDQATQLQHPPA